MDKKIDVLVIGGGPAGIIAAGKAAENGARVVLVEKNADLGVKLLLTGHGRCNLTNTEIQSGNLVEKYGKNGRFLFSALQHFGPAEVIEFFESRGVKTKVEENGRVFPVSDKAQDVLNALKKYLVENKVEILFDARVGKIIAKGKRLEKIVLADGRELHAEKYIICTGGKAWPQTGSTGDACAWLKGLGHTIVEPAPALAPIVCSIEGERSHAPVYGSARGSGVCAVENFKSLEGVSLRAVGLKVFQNNKKQTGRVGDVVFTANGMSGPAVFGVCKELGKLLKTGKVELRLDLAPDLIVEALDRRLEQLLREGGNKMIKNILNIVPARLALAILDLAEINPDKKANAISRGERKVLARLIKEFPLQVKSVCGFDQAMVTSGGVDLHEVDPRTMRSKIIENLYFAGEILDLDGPTGGYNLQICWSTGRIAGAK
ncbi:hypothetical protein A2482_03755 [Candidatus Falkowbacteria bacterium RIFOXYC2_FULL_48_21]|uniref:FAD-dependent oxidoreductase n=1 Tax=Candidatus Falkowbacteria bacterium RIFOXYC2_FULL_48_21 TaxID=1798005 RepID=A0A1F5TFV3_9BACT|nr:MAG: hypothetical protein A2482_03755 [Candidatus Falkowbacteria bacterium RIFOXYC2_FULL_48_21]